MSNWIDPTVPIIGVDTVWTMTLSRYDTDTVHELYWDLWIDGQRQATEAPALRGTQTWGGKLAQMACTTPRSGRNGKTAALISTSASAVRRDSNPVRSRLYLGDQSGARDSVSVEFGLGRTGVPASADDLSGTNQEFQGFRLTSGLVFKGGRGAGINCAACFRIRPQGERISLSGEKERPARQCAPNLSLENMECWGSCVIEML